MLNQVILVGKVSHCAQLESSDEGVYSLLSLLIESLEAGVTSDTIPVVLKYELAIQASKYLKIGSVVGVKARLVMNNDQIEVHAEKITFINTKESK